MLIGAKELGGTTLLRFYVLHCVGIPLIAAVLMAVHFWRIRKDGGVSGPLVNARRGSGQGFQWNKRRQITARLFEAFKALANILATPS